MQFEYSNQLRPRIIAFPPNISYCVFVSGTPGDDSSSAPTIILLPYGRMLVVDRNVFTQLNADRAGIDFMELSANLIRAHQLHRSSTRSVLDSENTSKGMSPVSLGCSPPSYDDIFGKRSLDLPPSYSELSLYVQRGRLKLDSMQGGDVNEDDVTCVMGVELVGVTRHFRGSAVAVDVEGGDHAGVARNGLDSPGSRVQIVPSSWKSLPNFGDQCSDPGARNSHHFSCGFRKTCSVNIEDETKRSNRTGEQNRPETSNKCETSRPGMPSSSERSNSSKRQGSVTAVRTPDCDETRSIFWRKNIKESHL